MNGLDLIRFLRLFCRVRGLVSFSGGVRPCLRRCRSSFGPRCAGFDPPTHPLNPQASPTIAALLGTSSLRAVRCAHGPTARAARVAPGEPSAATRRSTGCGAMNRSATSRRRDLRVPRDLPQPPTQTLGPGHAQPRRVRTTRPEPQGRSLKPSTPTPQITGHIRTWIRPGGSVRRPGGGEAARAGRARGFHDRRSDGRRPGSRRGARGPGECAGGHQHRRRDRPLHAQRRALPLPVSRPWHAT